MISRSPTHIFDFNESHHVWLTTTIKMPCDHDESNGLQDYWKQLVEMETKWNGNE